MSCVGGMLRGELGVGGALKHQEIRGNEINNSNWVAKGGWTLEGESGKGENLLSSSSTDLTSEQKELG